MKKNRIRILLIIILLVGLSLILIPEIQSRHQEHEVQLIVNKWKDLYDQSSAPEESIKTEPIKEPTVFPELYKAMELYNQQLYKEGQVNLKDAASYRAEVLNLSEYGVENDAVGIVKIPVIDVELPLYLGATDQHLSTGFAQLSQTSMPIGGNNTNCVIACHRGWRGSPYMRHVDEISIGDSIYVQNLWGTLEYKVTKMIVILPDELEHILIQPNRDLLTIVTCHPYGVGSHRYLVICERYESGVTPETNIPNPL